MSFTTATAKNPAGKTTSAPVQPSLVPPPAPAFKALSPAELAKLSDKDQIAYYQAENERLKARKGQSKLSLKVSDKGALSVYGLGRFPATFYKEQWVRLLDFGDDIRIFLADNDDKLSSKS